MMRHFVLDAEDDTKYFKIQIEDSENSKKILQSAMLEIYFFNEN